jgi:hypothetical protein
MATYSGQGVDIPITASGDLDTAQYRFVMPATTAKKVLQATGGSSPTPLGVLQNDPRDGEAGAVRIIGTTKVYGNTACGAITYCLPEPVLRFQDWLSRLCLAVAVY